MASSRSGCRSLCDTTAFSEVREAIMGARIEGCALKDRKHDDEKGVYACVCVLACVSVRMWVRMHMCTYTC